MRTLSPEQLARQVENHVYGSTWAIPEDSVQGADKDNLTNLLAVAAWTHLPFAAMMLSPQHFE